MCDIKTPPRNIQLTRDNIAIPAFSTPCLTKLGYGTGVGVYNLVRSPKANKVQSPWAIKKLFSQFKKSEYSKRLEVEAGILRSLKHPNIVGFRAFTKAGDGTPCLAMEKCEASLCDLIQKRAENGEELLAAEKILKVALHTARALDYLHTRVHLLHGDVKSANILVQGDFETCKLCDFGVCLPLTTDDKLDVVKEPEGEYVGSIPWNAPELLKYPQVVSSKADIFALGITLWETLANCVSPHCEDLVGDEESFEESFQSLELDESNGDICVLENDSPKFGTRPPLPTKYEYGDEYAGILQLFHCCTEEVPKSRPSAHHIIIIVDEIRNNSTK